MAITEKQRAERIDYLGGSDSSAALGLFGSRRDLWMEKTGRLVRTDEGNPDLERMEWGTLLEEPIALAFAKRMGVRVARVNQTLTHKRYPWMRANLDRRIIGSRAAVDCKNAGNATNWGEPGTDQVPVYVLCQAHHYLAVTEYEVLYIAALFFGNRLEVYEIRRDEEAIEELILGEQEFWNYVEKDIEPPPITLEEAVAMWPKSSARKVVATPEIVENLTMHAVERGVEKAAKERKESLQAGLIEYLQDADTLINPTGDIIATYKSPKDSQKVDHQGIALAYSTLLGLIADQKTCDAALRQTIKHALETTVGLNTRSVPNSRRFINKMTPAEE